MIRFAALIPALFLATPLLAQDKEDICATSAGIVDLAVEARSGGIAQKNAISTVGEGLEGDAAIYKPAVEPIVNWVYTLDEDLLNDDVGASYEKACMEQ